MTIQVRYRMHELDTGKGTAEPPSRVWAPYTDDPVIDYRDSDTVWVWIADDLCVEMNRDLVERLMEGFKEQEVEQ